MRKAQFRCFRLASMGALTLGLWSLSGTALSACLVNLGPQTRVGSQVTLVIVSKGEVAEYRAKGFTEIPCPTDRATLGRYVEYLCSSTGKDGVPALDTTARMGASRERACSSAKAGLAEIGG